MQTVFERCAHHSAIADIANHPVYCTPIGATIAIMGAMQAISYAFAGVATLNKDRCFAALRGFALFGKGCCVFFPFIGQGFARRFFPATPTYRGWNSQVAEAYKMGPASLKECLERYQSLQVSRIPQEAFIEILEKEEAWQPQWVECLALMLEIDSTQQIRFSNLDIPIRFAFSLEPSQASQTLLERLLEYRVAIPEGITERQLHAHTRAALIHRRESLFRRLQERGIAKAAPPPDPRTLSERFVDRHGVRWCANTFLLNIPAGLCVAAAGAIQAIQYAFTGVVTMDDAKLNVAKRGVILGGKGLLIVLPLIGQLVARLLLPLQQRVDRAAGIPIIEVSPKIHEIEKWHYFLVLELLSGYSGDFKNKVELLADQFERADQIVGADQFLFTFEALTLLDNRNWTDIKTLEKCRQLAREKSAGEKAA